MANKVFGTDYTDTTNPIGTETITINDGGTFKDVTLRNAVYKIVANAPEEFSVHDDDNLLLLDSQSVPVNDPQRVEMSTVRAWIAEKLGLIIDANTSKATPVDADVLGIGDSAASMASKKLTWGNLKATLSTALGGMIAGLTEKTSLANADDFIIADSADTDATKRVTHETLLAVIRARTRYKITPSVASNNLTIAIKTIASADPTTTNILVFKVGDTEYTVSAATSFTKNAGTNWCNSGSSELAAKDVDYFVYAIGETGASAGIKFGFSRIPYAETMGDFVNTSTSEKYIAGNWTNFNSTDSVECIGRFRARLSASASFNWSIPNAKVINKQIHDTDWMDWSPQLTNFSIGDGTMSAKYKVTYDIFSVKVEIVFGSTTAVSGAVAGATPLAFTYAGAGAIPLGMCNLLDSGTTTFYGSVDANASGGFRIRRIDASATNASLASIGATTPHTWAVNDEIDFNLPTLPLR